MIHKLSLCYQAILSGERRGFNPAVDRVFLSQHPYYPETTIFASYIPVN